MPPKKRRVSKAQPTNLSPNKSDSEEDNLPKLVGSRSGRRTSLSTGLVSSFFAPDIRSTTSKSLADLNYSAADTEALRAIVTALPERFPLEKAALLDRYYTQFPKWWAQWISGFSLLFYGYGCKKDLVTKFIKERTGDGASLCVDGLAKNLSARHILQHVAALATMVKPENYKTTTNQQLLEIIQHEAENKKIYLGIHNLDGPGLRDPASQGLLSELSAINNVHVAASVDHVNFPFLWDLQTNDRFSWIMHHVPTFMPLLDQVAAMGLGSLLVGSGKENSLTQQSALVVLSSLSPSAREIFRLIVGVQLGVGAVANNTGENISNSDTDVGNGGVSYQQLFQMCRDRFLVSNQPVLKTFLTEFRDHDLIRVKKVTAVTENEQGALAGKSNNKRKSTGAASTSAGVANASRTEELLYVPLEKRELEQLIEQMDVQMPSTLWNGALAVGGTGNGT